MWKQEKALVMFSGGQDSATCLAWALNNFSSVETIGFDYGQKHSVELEIRKKFLANYKAVFPEYSEKIENDHLLDLSVLGEISETSLTSAIAYEMTEAGLPNTFVPGRNLMFFTLAASVAYRRGAKHLIGGMCETDYSGYPDCRDDTIKAMQVALNLGLDTRLVLHTPLMWMDKADTWNLAHRIGGSKLIKMMIEDTHTCYIGDRSSLKDWGYGCGECPACELRKKGGEKYTTSKKALANHNSI